MDKHLFSEKGVWKSTAEFIDADGKILQGNGMSTIDITDEAITNESWVFKDNQKLNNNYYIEKKSANRYEYAANNFSIGMQKGFFDIHKNFIFSKFYVEGTGLNGYEVIERKGSTCYANGALYNENQLINTWTSVLEKEM